MDELGDLTGDRRATVLRRRHRRADRNREELRERRVDGGDVALHDDIAALAVAVADRLLQPGDRFVGGQDIGEREEARLHHRVDPTGQTGRLGHRGGVDGVQVQASVEHDLLHLDRQAIPDLVGGYGLLTSTIAPGAATLSTSIRSRKLHWCTPTNVA